VSAGREESRELRWPSRRRVLAVGATFAGVAGLRALVGPGARALAADAAPGGGPPAATARPSEQVLLVARREVAPAGQRLQGIVANQTFPSYELRAREGELLQVSVENELDEPTAIHFHGLVLPNAMDGVAGVTQQPIAPKGKFVYEIPLREAGTYFYESTWKLQRQLGLAGALVIEPREQRHAADRDEVVLLSDWTNADPAGVVPAIRAGRAEDPAATDGARPVNALPDGKPFPLDVRYNAYLLNGRTHRDAWTREVQLGQRVRLRLVNASAASFFRFQAEGHVLEVVAADGREVEPLEVDDVVLAPGERYDVLVRITGAGSFTLRAAALGASGGAVGVLHTPGVRPVVSTRPPRWGKRSLAYAQLRAVADTAFAGQKVERVALAIEGDERRYTWSVDGHAYPGEFVDGAASPVPPRALEAGSRVVLEIANRTALWQPLHLHGYRFRLLAAPAARARAPWKDTVAVAPRGSVELEILADQPGRWLLPSSHLYRSQAGLARLLSVG
jgi:FtsP/CotA-like multicopper oxidase with cupredoxin domain